MKIKLIAKVKDVILGYMFDSDKEITIGREIGNTIAPIIDSISRHHARIFFADGSWKVEDLGSTNGSLINGQKIEGPVALKNGDSLRFGLIDMSVTVAAAAAPARPAAASVPPLAPAAPKPAPALSPVAPAPKPAAAPALEPVAEMTPVADLEPIADLEPVTPAEASAPLSPIKPVPGLKRPTLPTKLKLPPRPALKLPPRKA